MRRIDPTLADRIARMALAAITRDYPSHIVHRLASDADAKPPRALTPAFFGSFDWHSAGTDTGARAPAPRDPGRDVRR